MLITTKGRYALRTMIDTALHAEDGLADGESPCSRRRDCATLRRWKELDQSIKNVVDRYTPEDLVRWQEAQQGNIVSHNYI